MPDSDDDLISVQEAAKALGVTAVRVREYIRGKRLPAQMVANSYVLRRGDIKGFRRLPAGRPVSDAASEASKRRRKNRPRKAT